VNGCCASRSRLHYLACHTTADRTAAHLRSDRHHAALPRSLLFDKHAAVHGPLTDDVAPIVDEEEALRADFIGSDDITAAPGRAQQGQTDGGTEQSEKDAVLAFGAIQAYFELREGGCVHERYSITLRPAS